ncbi:MAG: HD-GYP domain-containing protein (c-di-GMP phosphodiesterase class II) [Oleiphilaceae bacterium]|jgi:HD-GYP domain-containing protein (c-di-GMP phosphodiesterase class II)
MTDAFSHIDPVQKLGTNASLVEKLKLLHNFLKAQHPFIDRVAIALYDNSIDLLKTFTWLGDAENPLTHYQSKLENPPYLIEISETTNPRVVNNMEIYSDEKEAFQEGILNQLNMAGHIPALIVSHEQDVIETLQATIKSAIHFTHHHDPETANHIDRMSRSSRLIANELAIKHNFSDEFVEYIFLFSPLHDIGKISIPDSVLLKPGKLTPEEFDVMKEHAQRGREIIEALLEDFSLYSVNHFDSLKNIAQCHHEAIDSSGYPQGLTREQILIEARIVAVADIFDALISARPYKKVWTNDRAFETVQGMAGTKLDEECVAALLKNRDYVELTQEQFKQNSIG